MNKYITPDEFAEMFGYSKESQAVMRYKRKLPFTKLGRRVYYPLDEIEKMLQNNLVSII